MNQHTRLAPADHLVPFTADDFLRMIELGAFADMRAELVRGKLEKMMPAQLTHGEVNSTVIILLANLLKPIGARIVNDVVIRVSDTTVRAADVTVLNPGATPDSVLEGRDILLAVEVADTTLDRDMAEKRVDYANIGIPHYWVIDCNRAVVHVFGQPIDGDYAQVATVRFTEPLPVPGTDAAITIG